MRSGHSLILEELSRNDQQQEVVEPDVQLAEDPGLHILE